MTRVRYEKPPLSDPLPVIEDKLVKITRSIERDKISVKNYADSFFRLSYELSELISWREKINLRLTPDAVIYAAEDLIANTRNDFRDALHGARTILNNLPNLQRDKGFLEHRLLTTEAKPPQPVIIDFDTKELAAKFPDHIQEISYGADYNRITVYTKPLKARLRTSDDSNFVSTDGIVPIPPLKFFIYLKEPAGSRGKLKFAPIEFGYYNTFDNNSPHPHILAEGKPCLGDFDTVISDAFDSGDIEMMLHIIFMFLEQINAVEDQAGESWPNMFIRNKDVFNTLVSFELDFTNKEYHMVSKVKNIYD